MREMWFTFENRSSIMGGENYSCCLKELCSPCNWEEISYAYYFHKHGFKDADVKSVIIDGPSCKKIPEKLIQFFPNMESLEVRNTSITELEKESLIKFNKLKRFASFGNKISYLNGDLFEGFENLECIQFESSSFILIDPLIMDGHSLKHVQFTGNERYDLCYSSYEKQTSKHTLDEIKDHLISPFTKFKFVKDLQETVDLLSLEEDEEEKEDFSPYDELFTDIKKLLLDEKSKDLTINIDNKKFHVHKFVMCIRSPFFAKLFHEESQMEIYIHDIPVETFEMVLKYIYEYKLPEDTNFMALFAAASKLQIQCLKIYAEAHLFNQINQDNAITVFELGHKYDSKDLKVKAYKEIKKKYQVFGFMDEWLSDSDGLMQILDGFRKQEEELKKFRMRFDSLMSEEVENIEFVELELDQSNY